MIYKNTEHYLELSVIDNKGDFVSGLSIIYKIYKSSDNSLIDSGTMAEIGDSGIYKVLIIFTEIGQYRVEYVTPALYENKIETIMVEDINEKILRMLGLVQENYRILSPIYDKWNNLTKATIRIYNNASDCNDNVNWITEYELNAIFNIKKQMTSYKVIKK